MGAQTTNAQFAAIRKLIEDLGVDVKKIALTVESKGQNQIRMQTVKRTPRK